MKLKVTEDKKFIRVVETTEDELSQMKLSLSKKIKNHHFHPLVKKKVWDGSIDFMDKHGRIPFGLWDIIYNIGDKYDMKIDIEGIDEVLDLNFNNDDYIKWENEYYSDERLSNYKPRDYQTNAVLQTFKWKRCSHQIATSAGKTLILYNIFAYLKHIGVLGPKIIKYIDPKTNEEVETTVYKKMVIVVPTVQLVTQTLDKFELYSLDKEKLKYRAQPIFEGTDKTRRDADFVIGTYQSLRVLPDTFFDNTEVLGVDEAHTGKTKSVQTVFKKCISPTIKFGLSGTMKIMEESADMYTIQSNLGPLVSEVSSDFLFKHKYATQVKIKMLYLDYLDNDLKDNLAQLRSRKKIDASKLLRIERELIISNETRLNYILNLIINISNNSLVLFQDIKNGYGKKIYNRLLDICDNNVEVFYVDGSTDFDNREYYRKMMDTVDNKKRILVASFGTTSTGIDISNIHTIFLAESYKSEIIIKQTIGRGMRLGKNKDRINIIDIIDDFSYKGNLNYVYRQSLTRKEIYKNEKFPYKEYKIQLS